MDGKYVFMIRAEYGGGVYPGEILSGNGAAWFGYNGTTIPKVMSNALQETRMLAAGLLSAAHALSRNWEELIPSREDGNRMEQDI